MDRFFNGKISNQTLYLRDKVDRNTLLVGDIILCEVLQGFRQNKDFNSARQLLLSFSQCDMSNQTIALASADNYRYLRTKGITVRKTIDMLIATFCIQNKYQLLHTDKDFDVIEKYLPLDVYHFE